MTQGHKRAQILPGRFYLLLIQIFGNISHGAMSYFNPLTFAHVPPLSSLCFHLKNPKLECHICDIKIYREMKMEKFHRLKLDLLMKRCQPVDH